jgi:hypothetical protein
MGVYRKSSGWSSFCPLKLCWGYTPIFRHAEKTHCGLFHFQVSSGQWSNPNADASAWRFLLITSSSEKKWKESTRIWVNYNISLTWIKAIWGWCPLLTMNPVRENSEVVILYPDLLWGIYGKIYGKSMEHFWVSTKVTKVNPRLPGRRWSRSRSLDRLPVCKIGTARRRAPEVVGSWPPSLRETRV